MGDIRASREAAKVKARRAVSRRAGPDAERKRMFTALKADEWADDPYLSRLMRKHWRRGRNRTSNQIVVRADNYRTFTLTEGGDVWLAVPGLLPRETVKIPLYTAVAPSGTLRLILRGGRFEAKARTVTFEAVHAVTDKAAKIVAEDLTKTFASHRNLGANMNLPGRPCRCDQHPAQRRARLPAQDSSPAPRGGERNIHITLSNEQ